jgi:uncharacterized membrane protein YphA (DoxX/SURF4 family)
MKMLFLIGRILFGGYFLYSGIHHFSQLSMLSGYAASKNVPAPKLAVAGSGLLVFLGGLSILLGTWPHIGAVLIAVFLVGVSPAMHNFWTITEPNQRMAETINFSKNVALLGAALMLMIISEPWVLSLGH